MGFFQDFRSYAVIYVESEQRSEAALGGEMGGGARSVVMKTGARRVRSAAKQQASHCKDSPA
jgi:hypothetical protein